MLELELLISTTVVSMRQKPTSQNQKNSLFTARVVVNTTHGPLHLIEADIVEPLEAGADDGTHAMVRDQKVLLPAHEEMFALRKVAICEIGFFGLLGQRSPGLEARPMLHVGLFVGAP